MPVSVGPAVFLSYASQDAEVALRIGGALRAAGVEVWLDQEGGLVGGDVWDRKIREQIATCALFVPLISANTQARKEGYFRLEWHLAEERMRLIAKGVPFLVPVSIDGTTERGALVPDAFLAVQWTRLAPAASLPSTGRPAGFGGQALEEASVAAFVARVQKLLGASPEEPAVTLRAAASSPTEPPAHAEATPPMATVSNTSGVESLPPSPRVAPTVAPRPGRERLWQLATVVSLAVAAGMALLHFRSAPASPPVFRYTLNGPAGSRELTDVAISPDGKILAMIARVDGQRQLWLRALDGLETKPIPETDDASYPFWSPDGRYLGFFAQDKLKKVALGGGAIQTLCDAPTARGGSWSRDNVIIFANGKTGQVQRVAAVGGVPVDVTRTEASRSHPYFLPDGRRFLWRPVFGTTREGGVVVASLDGQEERSILEGRIASFLLATSKRGSHLLFDRNTTLMALPVDPTTAQAAGEAFPVADHVGVEGRRTGITVSATGVLVYATERDRRQSQVSWFDRSGKLLGPLGAPGRVSHPALSPDETRVIYVRRDDTKSDLWLRDLNSGRENRLTHGEYQNEYPFWAPQGDRIVFGSTRDGPTNLYQRAADGSGRDELLLPSKIQHTPSQWSRDGRYIVFSQRDIPESLWVLPLTAAAADRKPVRFLRTEATSGFGQISPDGRWMAFVSRKSGRREVYVRPFPSGEGESPISIEGGQAPRWRADGKEMFFVAPDGKMMAVPVNAPAGAKPGFEVGVPVVLFATTILSNEGTTRPQYQYDVTADGSRFLIAHYVDAGEASEPTLVVVTNWRAGLEK